MTSEPGRRSNDKMAELKFHQDTDDVKGRLAVVERDITHLGDAVASIERNMSAGFTNVQKAITAQKTPIPQMAGAALVVITLVGAVLWPQIQADARLEAEINQVSEIGLNHIRADKQEVLTQKISNVRRDLQEFQESYHRETDIRHADAIQKFQDFKYFLVDMKHKREELTE